MLKRPLSSEADWTVTKLCRPHTSAVVDARGVDFPHKATFHLSVLICKPESGHHHHWALQLHNLSTADCTIFEVRGASQSLQAVSYQCRRRFYRPKVIKTIYLAVFHLLPAGFNSLARAMEFSVSARNDLAEWNSQDYVFNTLDMLGDEWWIDINDGDYCRVRRKLERMRGPVDVVQKAVHLYPKPVPGEEELEESPSQEMDFDIKSIRSTIKEVAEDG